MTYPRSTVARWSAGAVIVLAATGMTAGCSSSSSPTPTSSSATVLNGYNSQDVTFLVDMVAHHQQAIDMAEMVPSHTNNAQVKALATKIEAAQGPEIAQMNAWLAEWNETPETGSESSGNGHNMSGMDHGGSMSSANPMGPGMMSAAQMADLESKSGAEFDRMWLTMMIAHHEGAVTMSEQELAQGENAQVKALAQEIINAQAKEIAEMQEMLKK
ncbi:MAG: DUF305 domain-containing protein [Candidatus Nanopelagicales bacterium]